MIYVQVGNVVCSISSANSMPDIFWTNWLEQEDLIIEEQAGFRGGRATIDHCLTIQQLIEKYASKSLVSLYIAFIDFKTAFDSASRIKLWEKLETMTIDHRVLYLIRPLLVSTSFKVWYNGKGHLSDPIMTLKGVKVAFWLHCFLYFTLTTCPAV